MHLNKQNISSKLNEVKGLMISWRTFSNKQSSNWIFKYSYSRNKIINKQEMLNEAQIYIICIDEQN